MESKMVMVGVISAVLGFLVGQLNAIVLLKQAIKEAIEDQEVKKEDNDPANWWKTGRNPYEDE